MQEGPTPTLGATVRSARHVRLVAALAALAVLIPAVGASSDGETTVSFEVAGTSGLSISTAAATATLTEVDGVASGALPETTITDARGGLLELTWNVTASGTSYVHSAGNTISAAEGHVYLPLTAVTELTDLQGLTPLLFEPEIGENRLDAPYSLLSGTSLLGSLGSGYLTYTPAMSVTIPDGQFPGTYTGTVTQTVSAS